MPQRYSQAKYEANRRYDDKAYDRLAIRVRKGRRDIYKQLAELRGESLAGMIINLLDGLAIDAGLMTPEDNGPEEDPEEE